MMGRMRRTNFVSFGMGQPFNLRKHPFIIADGTVYEFCLHQFASLVGKASHQLLDQWCEIQKQQ